MRRAAMALAPFAVFLLLVSPVYAAVMASLAPNLACVGSCAAYNGVDTYIEFGDCVAVSSGGNVHDISINLKKGAGSPSGSFTVGAKIYAETGSPSAATCQNSSLLGTSSTTIGYSALTSSFAVYQFLFAGITLTTSQVVLVAITMTIVGSCTNTCSVVVPFNQAVDVSQSGMDNFPTGMGSAGDPANSADNTVCSAQDFCPSYELNSGSSPPPPPPPPSPSTKASAFVGAVFVISMASIVLVAYERPDKTQEAVRYVGPIAVGLAVVFVVLAVAGV